MRRILLAWLLLGAPLAAAAAPAGCDECGTVLGVREIPRTGATTGVGAKTGALIGGLFGNRIAGSGYRNAGTLLGAAGGAMGGYVYEREGLEVKSYEIGVRLDDGSLRLFTQDERPDWKREDRVRVVNGALAPVQ